MYQVVTTSKALRDYLEGVTVASWDFETAPDEQYRDEDKAALDPHKSHIVGIGFSKAEGDAVYVPLTHRVGKNAANLTEIWDFLAEFFARPDVIKIVHNLAFESMFLYARGVVIQPPVYDTIAAAQMTLKGNTGFRSLADSGLKTLVPALLDKELPTFGEVTAGRHFDELDPSDPETIRYACADSDYTLRLYHVFNNWFDRWLRATRSQLKRLGTRQMPWRTDNLKSGMIG